MERAFQKMLEMHTHATQPCVLGRAVCLTNRHFGQLADWCWSLRHSASFPHHIIFPFNITVLLQWPVFFQKADVKHGHVKRADREQACRGSDLD